MFHKIFFIFSILSGIGVFIGIGLLFYSFIDFAWIKFGYAIGCIIASSISLLYFLQLNSMQNKINELEEKLSSKKKDER